MARDFVLKLALSSPMNERAAHDPNHNIRMVDSEEMAVRGTWWWGSEPLRS